MASQHISALLSGIVQLIGTKTTDLFATLRLGKVRKANSTVTARPVSDGLPIEQRDPDLVERAAVSQHIARLMLADEWTEIADQIAAWEADLASTPGGLRYHDVAVETALSGLQGLIDDMPLSQMNDLKPAETELSHFLATQRQTPDNHILALLAARAHLALGEACRADQWPEALHREAWRRMAHHFVQADEMLQDFDALSYMSPLLAEAHYLQALGAPASQKHLPDLFEDWVDLDPANPAIYERHAEYLCDTTLVSDETILHEADRALDRTEETIGFGGYALFFLPLLDQRENVRHLLDPDLFASAMLDLASMSASQSEINQTANALAAEIRACNTPSLALSDTLYMMISSYLTVIYPRHWTVSLDDVQALVDEAFNVLPVTDSDGFAPYSDDDALALQAA